MRITFLSVAIVACVACNSRKDVQCEQGSNCDLSGGGMCLAAPTGNMWCAYPDPLCPGGYRYSNQDVGDGVGGQCVPDGTQDAGVDSRTDARTDARPDSPDAPLGPVDFAVTYGGTQAEYVTNLSAVSDGILVTGSLGSNAMLGTSPLIYGGGADYVRAKLDTSGNVLWAFAQDSVNHELLGGSGTDAAGDMIIAGTFVGSVSFGGPTLASAGGYDLFLAKYAGSTGAHSYSVRYGTATDEHAGAICVDPAGDIYIAGYFSGTTNLGGVGMPSAGLTDGFVAKYRGSDGAYVWGVRLGGTQNDSAGTVACDGTRVVVGGTFAGTINVGGTDLVSAGQNDIFLAGFNATNGNHLWSSRYGSTTNDAVSSVTLVGGSVYTTGGFTGAVSFGGNTLSSNGSSDVYVAKYDGSTGSYVWSKTFGSSGSEIAYAVIGAGANIAITGTFNSVLNFGGGDLSSAGGDDVFVATLAQADGSYVDAFRLGGVQSDEGYALANTPTGLVVGGGFQGTTYFGTIQATSHGMSDGFIFKP